MVDSFIAGRLGEDQEADIFPGVTVAQLLEEHVSLDIECVDRLYLNGYIPSLSIWQLEFSRTQVFERPMRGRQFFESVIRESLDLGRPERVQLVFDRQVRKTTPGRFSTRVVTNGVCIPASIHIKAQYTAGKMTYDLRRLRLKGIIARVPGTTRYFLTHYGYRVALFTTRVHARILRRDSTASGRPRRWRCRIPCAGH